MGLRSAMGIPHAARQPSVRFCPSPRLYGGEADLVTWWALAGRYSGCADASMVSRFPTEAKALCDTVDRDWHMSAGL